jgi:hypothetical protein
MAPVLNAMIGSVFTKLDTHIQELWDNYVDSCPATLLVLQYNLPSTCGTLSGSWQFYVLLFRKVIFATISR